nr:hypothetical protein [Candidatus Sigynarchaeota archaeon]
MQTTKSINVQKVLAWTIILIAVVEWLPFFLEIMLNFINMELDELPYEDVPLILAPLLSPIVIVVFSIIGWKHHDGLKKFSSVASIVALVLGAGLTWLCFSAYYQFYSIFAADLSSLDIAGSGVGMLDYLTPAPRPLLYWTNAFTFYVLVPVLFNVGTGGTSRIQYSHELNLGTMVAAAYMFLRPGSFVGTMLRFAIALLVAGTIWCIAMINKKTGDPEIAREPVYFIDSDAIPKGSEHGIALILGFSLLNFAMSANGLLINTWTWLFLVASTMIAEVVILKKKLVSVVPGIVTFASLIAVECIVIWADINAVLLGVEPWLQGLGLFLLGLLFPTCLPLFSKKRTNRYLIHPARIFFFNMIAAVALILPILIITTLPPLTTLIGILLVSVVSGFALVALLVPYYKKK